MTEPHLTGLPEEVLTNIAGRLDVDSLCSMRLTCVAVSNKTTHAFVSEHFEARAFMFTSKSLNTLLQIASSPKLRGQLNALYFVPSLYTRQALRYNQPGSHLRRPTTRHLEAWTFLCDDQRQLMSSHRGAAILREVFQLLPQLRTVGLVDTLNALPIQVDCYGLQSAERLTRMLPTCAPMAEWHCEFFALLYHLWMSILAALAASGRSTLVKLFTFLHPHSTLPLMVAVQPSPEFRTGLAQVVANVTHLQLQLRGSLDVYFGGGVVEHCRAVTSFAQLFVATTTLVLGFDHSDHSAVLLYAFLKGINAEKLKLLFLRSTWVEAKVLTQVLLKAKSLEDVQLMHVYIIKGTWIPVLCALQGLEKLGHLHLMDLGEYWQRVAFLHAPDHSSQEDDDDDDDADDEEDEDDDDDDDGTNAAPGQMLLPLPMIGTGATLNFNDGDEMSLSAYSTITAALNDNQTSDGEAPPDNGGSDTAVEEDGGPADLASSDSSEGGVPVGTSGNGSVPAEFDSDGGVPVGPVSDDDDVPMDTEDTTSSGTDQHEDETDGNNANEIEAPDHTGTSNADANNTDAGNAHSGDDNCNDDDDEASSTPLTHMQVMGTNAEHIGLDPRDHSTPHHQSPANIMVGYEIWGTWVCIYGGQIAQQLPILRSEYNITDMRVTLATGAVITPNDDIPDSDMMVDDDDDD